jgi:hypothetical protein
MIQKYEVKSSTHIWNNDNLLLDLVGPTNN